MLRLEDLLVANLARRQGLLERGPLARLLGELDALPERASLVRALVDRGLLSVEQARPVHEAARRRVRRLQEEAYAAEARKAGVVAPEVLQSLGQQLARDGYTWTLGQRLVEAHGLERPRHDALARDAARRFGAHEEQVLRTNRGSGYAQALGTEDSSRLARSGSGELFALSSSSQESAPPGARATPGGGAAAGAPPPQAPDDPDGERTTSLAPPGGGGGAPGGDPASRTLLFDETLPTPDSDGAAAQPTVQIPAGAAPLGPPGGASGADAPSGSAGGAGGPPGKADPFATIQTPAGGANGGGADPDGTMKIAPEELAAAAGSAPRTIDRYPIVRELGRGNMGVVYLARDPEDDRFVALKLVHGPSTEEAQARFKREILVSQRVDHEYVIRALDAGELPDGSSYMVMEYLEGEELRALMERSGPVPVERALTMVEQVLQGLAAVHAQKIVHRDMKPENVQALRRHGEDHLKVVDFGISRILDLDDEEGEEVFVTVRGTLSGTPSYVAPEAVLEPETVRPSHDIYAVGVMLFELLTGRLPFPAGRNIRDVLSDTVNSQPPPLGDAHPEGAEFPAAVERLVRRLMEKDPESRPSDAEQALAALAEVHEPEPEPAADRERRGPLARLFGWLAGIFRR